MWKKLKSLPYSLSCKKKKKKNRKILQEQKKRARNWLLETFSVYLKEEGKKKNK